MSDSPTRSKTSPTIPTSPARTPARCPVWFLSRMSREHVTVALSGEGGRRVVRRLPDVSGRPLGGPAPGSRAGARAGARRGQRCCPVPTTRSASSTRSKRLLEGSLLPRRRSPLFWNGACSPSQKRALPGLARPGCSGSYDGIAPRRRDRLSEPLHAARPALLSAGRHPVQSRSHEHGAFAGSAAAAARSPHRGVRGTLPEKLKIRGCAQKSS